MDSQIEAKFPQITYFVESREQAEKAITEERCRSRGDYLNQQLVNDDALHALRETRGRLSIALNEKELKDDAALIATLKSLSGMGIPMDMWANLADQDGYWVHAGNINVARRRVLEMFNFTERRNVDIENVGLDLEMPIGVLAGNPLRGYMRTQPWKFSQEDARDQLNKFIEEILKTEYGVKTYEIPMLGDWAFTRRALGIPAAPEIESDKYERVGMVYTSVKPPLISPERFIKRFSKGKNRTPALGIVSANNENPGRNIHFDKLLTDAELQRDVKAALSVSPDRLHVFAMNGVEVIRRVQEAVSAVLSQS